MKSIPLLGRGATLHEVAGDSAILVDPLNMDEIADGMRLLAHMGHEEAGAPVRASTEHRALFAEFGGGSLALLLTRIPQMKHKSVGGVCDSAIIINILFTH
jgi:hypothetical protein